MQSGISATADLHTAFQHLLTDPSQRGLLAIIQNESLVPSHTLPRTSSTSTLTQDLPSLDALLTEAAAAYILLKHDSPASAAASQQEQAPKCTAITYVPSTAPVRQKTLFASARLTLVRDLGTEHFASTLFATGKDELTPEGWEKQEAHGALAAPLTEEEENLRGIREAEASESMGTGGRRGGHIVGGSGSVGMGWSSEAVDALSGLEGRGGAVVLQLDLQREVVVLEGSYADATARSLGSTISGERPTYSFYRHAETGEVLFVYCCPPGCSVKERMTYAASARSVPVMAEKEAGVNVGKKMEVSGVDEVSERDVLREMEPERSAAGGGAGGFARPKRPGRR